MSYRTGGRLHVIHEARQITERFRKREFVVELDDGGRFPQFVLFQLTGDRCGLLDDFEVGARVEVEFSLRGRQWRSPSGDIRYFNSLDVWTLKGVRDDSAGFEPVDFGAPPPTEADDPGIEDDDDVPF